MIICNECIHFGVCMGFYKCKRFERRENATVRITGYEVDGGNLSAVYITDETREIEQKKYVEDRPHGEWKPKQMIVGGNGAVFMHNGYECKCGRVVTQRENFCPECGADMRPREGDRNE